MYIDYFWAKKDDKQGAFKWLPLSVHLQDTKAIADRLWNLWLSDSAKNLITNSLSVKDEEASKNFLTFLAYIHDIGKATPAFQTKPGFNNSSDLDTSLLQKLESIGFYDIKDLKLTDIKASHHTVAGQFLLQKFGVGADISSIIGAHHGTAVDSETKISNQIAYKKNYYQSEDEGSEIYKKWDFAQRQIFETALAENNFKSAADLPKAALTAQVLLTGLIIMADWISSNEEYFPLINIYEDTISDRDKRTEYGWNKWSHNFKNQNYKWEPFERYDIDEIYKDRFGFPPYPLQREFSEIVEGIKDPGIVILEAPMGIGKTEASLVAVEQLAAKDKLGGMFFGLPTQATSNGIFPRIKEWLEAMQDEDDENFSLRLKHGKAALNDVFNSIAKNVDTDNPEGVKDGAVFVNSWFSGKKTSNLDEFIVGTVDQFLLLSLKQKHLFLRHLGFANKVMVLDEVHAYDSFMSQYLYQSLRWMGAYKVPVILLSATLPYNKRVDIVENYLKGRGYKKKEFTYPEGGISKDAYPLITYTDGSSIKEKFLTVDENKTVSVERLKEDELYQKIEEFSKIGGAVGVIVNTVKRSQEIAEVLIEKYGEDAVELIHSSFIATKRVAKENLLMNTIGKGKKRPDFKIIVGTQVLEQSLDIDFDVMITDLCPIDLLIQRIGRLHRHKIERPKGFEKPKVYVLGTSDELEFQKGSVAVYGGYLLARTQYYLKDKIVIPKDISPLVQKVYGDEVLKLSDEVLGLYDEMKSEFESDLAGKISRAQKFKIGNPSTKIKEAASLYNNGSSLMGWTENYVVDGISGGSLGGEERSVAQVRDSDETVEVIAVKKSKEGYSVFGEDIDIKDKIGEFEISKKLAGETLKLPRLLLKKYNIEKTIKFLEKYNMNYLSNWQKQPWLRGSLGIIFDENNEFIIEGIKLRYDEKLGLIYERV